MSATLERDWTTANQRLLAGEFARLRALLGAGELATAIAEVEEAQAQLAAPAAIDAIASLLELSCFERDLLLLVAGVEMDAKLAARCGEARGERDRPWATFGLALASLPQAHWSAIAPDASLRRYRLIEVEEGAALVTARLKLEERVLHCLAGINHLDARLAPLFDLVPPAAVMAETHREVAQQLVACLRSFVGRPPVVLLSGDDREAQVDVAATVAHSLGVVLLRLHATEIPASAHERAALAALWQREAVLLGGGLLIQRTPEDSLTTLSRFVARIEGLVMVAGCTDLAIDGSVRVQLRETTPHDAVHRSAAPTTVHCAINRPDVAEQRQLFRVALADRAEALAPVLDAWIAQHPMSARHIAHAARSLRISSSTRDIVALLRSHRGDSPTLPGLVQAIEPRAAWDDLVLPEAQRSTLQQIAQHVRHRATVYHDWGFAQKSARGLGIAALFWGDSGTGKTLAAEVLAGALDLPLYRIDLSAVVSKYIGETEKNLRAVFDAAEDHGAVLLFDEADALFGKRSEVKDSHDRYANIEVSYLLQRMEAYRGLAILTTNHKTALDTSFQRRLRFVVHFPFPDEAQREAIWRTMFPAMAPLAGLDFAKLRRLHVSGGTIRNIALHAAFLAAEAGTPVTMAHLLHAAHREAAKREKPFAESETRGWA